MTEWRAIRDFEGIYEVSDEGQVRRIAPGPLTYPGKVLRPRQQAKGYLLVVLHNRGHQREALVHRLVAETFLPSPAPDRVQVNHLDGDPTNNALANLEWCTNSENMRHSIDVLGRRVATAGSGEVGRVLAERYGVSNSLISAIRRGECWPSGVSV